METNKTIIPANIQTLFGKPPLLRGEDDGVYHSLMEAFAMRVEPTDVIEWWWLKGVTDDTWDIRRLQRIKVLIVELQRDMVFDSRRMLAASCCDEDAEYEPVPMPDSEKDSAALLKGCINEYRHIDKLIESAERRRDRKLREIERRREDFARRLRKASKEVDKAEIVKLRDAA